MLTWIEIAGYRGFRTYRMDGLTRVNLLVGKNNSGKTALLEAVQFLTTGDPRHLIVDPQFRRGELISVVEAERKRELSDVSHIFYGHKLAVGSELHFSGNQVELLATIAHLRKENRLFSEEQVEMPARATVLSVARRIRQEADELSYFLESGSGIPQPLRPLAWTERGTTSEPSVGLLLSTDSLGTLELAKLWDEIVLTGQEDSVINALKLLNSDVESVNFLTGVLASSIRAVRLRGGIVVGLNGQGRVPLGSLGDGMRRMLALATALSSVNAGSLFVDEIDTGLHYSALADMWKMIVARAAAAGAQVFATTHSWDCIAGLAEMCEENPEIAGEVSVHKITTDLKRSVPFAGESLGTMARGDIDPR